MQDKELYQRILGLEEPWEVKDIDLDIAGGQVVVQLVYAAARGQCPECGKWYAFYDHARQRRWRHLDTCQLRTEIRCRVPRVSCKKHGVKTLSVPWAEPHGRFTLMFEWLCVQWLKAARNQTQVARCLGLSLDEVHGIMRRAVDRGLARRDEYPVRQLGLDEKSMKRGHNYLTVLTDLENRHVFDVAEGRRQASAEALLDELTPLQRRTVDCVCMDMWGPFHAAVERRLPEADIVHDRFHVSKHLNDAVDKTRRAERKELEKRGEEGLKRAKYLFLKGFENLTTDQFERFERATRVARKTSAAWECKELFRAFWEQPGVLAARNFLAHWYKYAKAKKLPALRQVAAMLLRHAQGLVNFVNHRITNAVAENINGKIQQLKSIARGFRSFKHYRTNILFHFAGLDLNPLKTQ